MFIFSRVEPDLGKNSCLLWLGAGGNCVRYLFLNLFGLTAAKIAPLLRGKPHSPNINHCVSTNSIWKSLGLGYIPTRLVPTPSRRPIKD